MDKRTNENVINTENKIPYTEVSNKDTHNGSSDLDDIKKALERQKLELEIDKIKADKRKTDFETTELEKPFFRKQVFFQSSIPAVISLLALILSVYFSVVQSENRDLTKQKTDLEKAVGDLEKKEKQLLDDNKNAQAQQNQLNEQIKGLKAETEEEKREKEKFERENASLDERQRFLDTQIATLNTQKEMLNTQNEISKAKIEGLKIEQDNLVLDRNKLVAEVTQRKNELAQKENDLRIAKIEGKYLLLKTAIFPFSNDLEKNFEEIKNIYQSDSAFQQNFDDFIKSQSENSNEKQFAALLGYVVTDNQKWKNQLIDESKRFALNKGNLSILKAGLWRKDEDKSLLISLLLDSLEKVDEGKRLDDLIEYQSILGAREGFPKIKKEDFLRLIKIARDDFLKNGPVPFVNGSYTVGGSEILFQRSLPAYFSVAGKILAKSNLTEGERDSIRNRIFAFFMGFGRPLEDFGFPKDNQEKNWQNWVCKRQDIINLWLEPKLKTLEQDDGRFQEAVEMTIPESKKNHNCF